MRPAAPYPQYYTPPGIPKPEHIPWLAPARLEAAASPDGAEGMYWGTQYDALSRGCWLKSAAGWYVLMTGCEPGHCARLRVLPGPVVAGVREDHPWMVPQLLRWHPDAALISAVPEIYQASADGTYGWLPPKHLQPIMDRLRALLLWGQGDTIPIVSDDDAVDLAIAILGINYHVTSHELALAGWLDTELVRRVLLAAGGVTELNQTLAGSLPGDARARPL